MENTQIPMDQRRNNTPIGLFH